MFFHHKDLAYTVRVDKPNPVFARLLQQAIGGPEGEMRVMNQYLFQAWGVRGPDATRYRDMLLATGTEEIGHIELLATAVAMNLEGAPEAMIDDVVTNPVVAARMGGLEPRHILTSGLSATPADANGVPFSAACLDIGGNLLANLHANVAAEAIGRTLAARLRALTDDPGMKDLLSYLIARDSMHQQQWLAAAAELNPEGRPVPIEVADENGYTEYSHAFLNHTDKAPPQDAPWVSGIAPDGGAFTAAEPAGPAGQEPQLAPAPPYAFAGPESTGEIDGTGLFGKLKAAVTS